VFNRQPKMRLQKGRVYKRRIEKCAQCGSDYEVYSSIRKSRFCSLRCLGVANRNQVSVKCAGCGKSFTRGEALVRRTKKQYCTKECFHQYHEGENTPQWRGGNNHYRGRDWNRQSEAARQRDGLKCQVCGKPQAKKEKLSVDHIVAYRLVKRNDLVNLISVCRAPCHNSKTHRAERMFLEGNLLGFKQELAMANWPMDKVEAAIQWYGAL